MDTTTQPGERLSPDAHYLDTTARLFDWHVAWQRDGSVLMSKGDRTLHVFFDPASAFRYGRATGPVTCDEDLTMCEAVAALEDHGNPPPLAR